MDITKELLEQRREELLKQLTDIISTEHYLRGQLDSVEYWLSLLEAEVEIEYEPLPQGSPIEPELIGVGNNEHTG